MRSLKRNQQTIWYAKYLGEQTTLDEAGYETGEPVPTYSNPISCQICVSSTKGDTEDTLFGKNVDYDRTMTTHDKACEIDEYCLLWIDIEPVIDVDGKTATKHDYVVTQVGKAKIGTNIVYAINKVS